MRGYPTDKDGEFIMIVELLGTGSWSNLNNTKNVVEATGLPGRTVQVRRVSKAAVEKDLQMRVRIATVLETTGILLPCKKPPKKVRGDSKKKAAVQGAEGEDEEKNKDPFALGKHCQVDGFQDGNYTAAEILKVHGNGKFTVKMNNGALKGVTIETSKVCDLDCWACIDCLCVQPYMDVEASAEDIAEGKNIWHWEAATQDISRKSCIASKVYNE